MILYKSEYYVGQYISIERLISDTKENYYEALQEAHGNGMKAEMIMLLL